jgi:DNA-binding LytR/AlgR family response regulator
VGPIVIFVTAYDESALRAFEAGAREYLLHALIVRYTANENSPTASCRREQRQ